MVDIAHLVHRIEREKKEDVNHSFFYHGWVVPSHKCMCMMILKAASTTVKATLYNLAGHAVPGSLGELHSHDIGMFLGQYDAAKIAEIFSSPEWTRFCFVRNPYHRLLSAYRSKVGNTWDLQYDWLREAIREEYGYPLVDGRRAGMVTFTDFVRFLVKSDANVHYGFVPTAAYDGHFIVQSRVLMQDLVPYDFVGRFENLPDDLVRILARLGASEETIALASVVRNPTGRVPLATAYSHEFADLVYELYREDFESLGYEKDSWLFDG